MGRERPAAAASGDARLNKRLGSHGNQTTPAAPEDNFGAPAGVINSSLEPHPAVVQLCPSRSAAEICAPTGANLHRHNGSGGRSAEPVHILEPPESGRLGSKRSPGRRGRLCGLDLDGPANLRAAAHIRLAILPPDNRGVAGIHCSRIAGSSESILFWKRGP